FPFQKLDFVALPGFQYGGMEHVGAIQYNQASLFLDESATERQLLRRAKLIAHETSHMWFGDLVTMAWFNDVWMKEVFANFMADKISHQPAADMDNALPSTTARHRPASAQDRTRWSKAAMQPLGKMKWPSSLYGGSVSRKPSIMMRPYSLPARFRCPRG